MKIEIEMSIEEVFLVLYMKIVLEQCGKTRFRLLVVAIEGSANVKKRDKKIFCLSPNAEPNESSTDCTFPFSYCLRSSLQNVSAYP